MSIIAGLVEMTEASEPEYRPVTSDPLTLGLFTRSGAQCGVCSAWRFPCDTCKRQPARIVTERDVRLLLREYEGRKNGIQARRTRGASVPKLRRTRKGARAVLLCSVSPSASGDGSPLGHGLVGCDQGMQLSVGA